MKFTGDHKSVKNNDILIVKIVYLKKDEHIEEPINQNFDYGRLLAPTMHKHLIIKTRVLS